MCAERSNSIDDVNTKPDQELLAKYADDVQQLQRACSYAQLYELAARLPYGGKLAGVLMELHGTCPPREAFFKSMAAGTARNSDLLAIYAAAVLRSYATHVAMAIASLDKQRAAIEQNQQDIVALLRSRGLLRHFNC
jgi:hypothetical protein